MHGFSVPIRLWSAITDHLPGQGNHKDVAELPSQTEKSPLVSYRNEISIVVLAFVVFLFVVVKNAWVSDDAYITFRTVDNFLHGYGLTWNTDDRVQVYTHPLWMFLVSAVTFFGRDVYFSTLLLSLSFSAVAIWLLATRFKFSPINAAVAIGTLTASKAFVDYSTSGLENPLTHLLLVAFALVFYFSLEQKRSVLWLSLLSMLMILNRMDTILFLIPALLYVLYKHRSWRTLFTMALAFLPFALWELFSLFYYGFLFPNTAYAKLNTGIDNGPLIRQGIAYLVSSFSFDPLLLIVILAGLLLAITQKDWKSLPLMCGMVLYIGYTVKVGGDFMAGRFLTPPFLLAIILLFRNLSLSVKPNLILILAIVLFVAFITPNSRIYSFIKIEVGHPLEWIDARGVADERAFYSGGTAIMSQTRDNYIRRGSSVEIDANTERGSTKNQGLG